MKKTYTETVPDRFLLPKTQTKFLKYLASERELDKLERETLEELTDKDSDTKKELADKKLKREALQDKKTELAARKVAFIKSHSAPKDKESKFIKAHTFKCPYDTKDIKENCADCDASISYSEERYITRGNYCAACNARYNGSNKCTLCKKVVAMGEGDWTREFSIWQVTHYKCPPIAKKKEKTVNNYKETINPEEVIKNPSYE